MINNNTVSYWNMTDRPMYPSPKNLEIIVHCQFRLMFADVDKITKKRFTQKVKMHVLAQIF